jgi:hypothetical protein
MVHNHHQVTATKAVDTASFLTFFTGKPLVYTCPGRGEIGVKYRNI